MDVIVPVAGLGTRLRPQTWSKPKPLVSVAGKPMLEHVLDRIMPYAPRKLVFITGYLGDQIEAWARKAHPDVELAFVEQPEMLGQTDAIIRTRGICNDDALVLFPDALFEADFSGLDELAAAAVIFTKDVADPSALGVTLVENGFVTKLIEKPAAFVSSQATVGLYYFKRIDDLYDAIDEQIRRELRTKGEFFIADAMQLMIDSGKKFVTRNIDIWEDCGNAEALLQTNRYLLTSDPPSPAQRAASVIIPPSFVSRSAEVEKAVIGPYASIGAGARVKDCVIRDAIVEDEAKIEGVILEHSIVGRGAEVVGQPSRLNVADTSKVHV